DAVFGLTFSADGSRYAYTAKVGEQYTMVIDGKESGRHPVVGGLVFSNDGKRVAYVVEPAGADGKPGGKQQMIYDDGTGAKAFQPVDGIGTVAFSPPDGRRVAISMQGADKKWQVFVDGKASAKYDAVGGLLFSPDGKRLAALAGTLGPGGGTRGSQQFLVVDGKELPPADVIAGAAWSPENTRVGYIAFVGGQRWLTVEDRRLGPGSFFSFSPDGRHVAHAIPVAGGSSTKAVLAVDGGKVPGAEYDAFLLGSRFVWEGPKTARVIAGRGHAVYLARVTVE
ncbi:MAG TPA: WD40 repeat domain-containing protein, partial [Humisphaera sp.]